MITVENGKIVIDHEDALQIGNGTPFKALFPFARWRKDKWEIMATFQNVEVINRYTEENLSIEVEHETTDDDLRTFLESNQYHFKREPYRHQIEALAKGAHQEYFAYFLEPGLGKTKILVDNVGILYQKQGIDTVLVLCPKSVMYAWVDEIKANMDDVSVGVWPDSPPNGYGKIRWYIMNPDALVARDVALRTLQKKMEQTTNREEYEVLMKKVKARQQNMEDGYSVARLFLYSSFHSMMVIDESTCISHIDSLRTEVCEELGKEAEYRRILTGDPIANTPIDLYSQLNWLSPDCVMYRNYYAFRNHFCDMGGFKNKQIIGYKNMSELRHMVNKYGYRARTKDVMDMPPQNWIVRTVTPSAHTVEIYDQIVNDDILLLFEHHAKVSTSMILTKMTKLQQVCGGTLLDDEGVPHIVGNEKLTEVKAMLEEWHMSGILIWYHYRAEGHMLQEELQKKYKVRNYNGDLSAKERTDTVNEFEAGHIDILLVQDDAGHLGITLNNANYAIFYSNHQRPLVRNQSERRNWRIGQKSPVFYYDILFKGMNDSWLYRKLKERREFNATITDRSHWSKQEVMEAIYDTVL